MNQAIGIIGCGHIAQALLQAWKKQNMLSKWQFILANRSPGKLKRISQQFGVLSAPSNESLVERSRVVILAMKPQDLQTAVEALSSIFSDEHIIVSLAAGFSIQQLQKMISKKLPVVRIMPTASIQEGVGVIGYSASAGAVASHSTMDLIRALFEPLGLLVESQEGESFGALTVACASGLGFVFELMQYWQEWLEEHDFDPETARKMVVETFLGASLLSRGQETQTLDELQARVISKKGVTAAGLASIRELEVERALRYSFEKAALRERELAGS